MKCNVARELARDFKVTTVFFLISLVLPHAPVVITLEIARTSSCNVNEGRQHPADCSSVSGKETDDATCNLGLQYITVFFLSGNKHSSGAV